MKERRKRQRSAWSPYYCGFTDRRQPEGVVVTWDRTVGGELIRTRRDLIHTARVLVAKRGPTPDEQAELTALPFGTLTWDESAPFPAEHYVPRTESELREGLRAAYARARERLAGVRVALFDSFPSYGKGH